jgi:hypothetical protein
MKMTHFERRSFAGGIIIMALLITSLASVQINQQPSDGRPELPFEITSEQRHCCIGGPTWTAVIFLPKDDFNQENLNRLFRFYSKRHPDKQEKIIVDVFVSNEKMNIGGTHTQQMSSIPNSSSQDAQSARWRKYGADAIFTRQGDGAASGGGDNEWYTYIPDLAKPEERKTVVLKGGRKFAPKTLLETWASSAGGFDIRLRSYELEHVEPNGTYYTFEAKTTDSDDWTGIITLRLDEKISLPTENLHVVNEQITYFFFGWMYAVTIDGGKTWKVWDGNDEASSSGFIERISLTTDGVGQMIYRVNPSGSHIVKHLNTKDFGQHWANK